MFIIVSYRKEIYLFIMYTLVTVFFKLRHEIRFEEF
jgi:hypothetical protein